MAAATAAVATQPRSKIEAVVAGAATAAAVVVPKAGVAEPGAVAVPKGNAEPKSPEDLSETHVTSLRKAIAPSPERSGAVSGHLDPALSRLSVRFPCAVGE